MLRFTLWDLALALLLAAGGCDTHDHDFVKTDVFVQGPSEQADILWVVDDSVSMEQEIPQLIANSAAFLDPLLSNGVDFHIGVTTTDLNPDNPDAGALVGPVITSSTPDSAAEFQAQLDVGTDGSDLEMGLAAPLAALLPPLVDTANAGFLRADASLAIIVVSDENDCSGLGDGETGEDCYNRYDELTPVEDLVAELRAIKQGSAGPLSLSGLVGPDYVEGCTYAVPGKRYAEAIDRLGGVREDICDPDYPAVMGAIGVVASGLRSTFHLSWPAVADTIEVSVTDVYGNEVFASEDPQTAWAYVESADGSYGNLVFLGAAVPPRGATIGVEYTCARDCGTGG